MIYRMGINDWSNLHVRVADRFSSFSVGRDVVVRACDSGAVNDVLVSSGFDLDCGSIALAAVVCPQSIPISFWLYPQYRAVGVRALSLPDNFPSFLDCF